MEPNTNTSVDAPSQENANLEQLHIPVSVTTEAEKDEKPLYRETVILAGILGLFLGSFGVHNFMIRRTKRGIVQASITASLFGLAIILLLIAFFDGFKCGTGEIGSCQKLNIPFDVLIAICSYAVGGMAGWGAIESLIMLIKAGKYPLKNDPYHKDGPHKSVSY